MPGETFVFEPIQVDVSSIPAAGLAKGAPACPMRFAWRGKVYRVAKVLETTKVLRAHDSDQAYVKAHAFRVLTDEGLEMVIRCDRQIRGNPWRLYTVRNREASSGNSPEGSRF